MTTSVALVEDDAVGRDWMTAALAEEPDLNLLWAAGDIASGRRSLIRHRPDVLLVDLGLPDGNGIELIRTAVQICSTCDVMVITAFGDQRHVIEAIEAGATGYLHKDVAKADLASHIRTLRSGGSPVSPVIARQLLVRLAGSASAPSRAAVEAHSPLSSQEHQVLLLSSKGYTYLEIARMLGVSCHSVQTYVKRSYRKLQAHSKTEAVYEARRMGWLGE